MKTMKYTFRDEEDVTGESDITIFMQWEPITNFSINDVLTMQVHNIWGDKATAPALLNQIGMLSADAKKKAKIAKLEKECLFSELFEVCEKDMTITVPDAKKNLVDRAPSSTKVEAAVKRNSEYKRSVINLIKAEQIADQLDSIYWAMVSKIKQMADFKTDLKPTELLNEIVEENINGFTIKKTNGRIGTKANDF